MLSTAIAEKALGGIYSSIMASSIIGQWISSDNVRHGVQRILSRVLQVHTHSQSIGVTSSSMVVV